jgi:Spy/CpxP family protein refolding chaperone
VKRLAAVLLLASAASPILAVPEMPEGKWWKRPRIAAEIDLSSRQEEQIESIFTKARPQLIDLKANLQKKQGELEDVLSETNADRARVAARIESVENARAELQKARILMLLDMKQVLRPEQWDRLVRMHQEMRRERRERFGRFLDRRRPTGPRPR